MSDRLIRTGLVDRSDNPLCRVVLCDDGMVSCTVASLVEHPMLRTRMVAGRGGAERVVSWAHTCEVEDPWNWLGSGDLLMTDGYSLPREPDAQAEFIRQLAQANIAGLALGEGFVAPPLTEEARAVADELGFPVLMTARAVPFVTISRVVAEMTTGRGNSRAARVLRLYDILRRSHSAGANDELVDQLGRELRARVHVVDLALGRELLPASVPLPPELVTAVLERYMAQGQRLSGFNRLAVGTTHSALFLPVGTDDRAALVIHAYTDADSPDLMLAQHAAMIVELEVERRAAQAARDNERGWNLVRRMLDASIDPEAAARQLRTFSLGKGPWRVASLAVRDDVGGDRPTVSLAHALSFVPWPHLHADLGDSQLLLVREDQDDFNLEDVEATVGWSQPFTSTARLADAFREARWALESAQAAGVTTAVYGTHGSYFMPTSVAEGEVAVQKLLGPLLAYDTDHGTNLVESLRVYFESNRSWKEGARRLGVHKQTLAYRIHKVEELTGADLRDFGVQAELFLALRTLRLLNAE